VHLCVDRTWNIRTWLGVQVANALVQVSVFHLHTALDSACVWRTLMSMTSQDILISGAGIAGTTAAYWLREAGYTVTVVERAPAPRAGGQTVDLRGAGRTVVERMGLLDQIRAKTVTQRGIAWVDASGRHRAEMPVEAFGGNGIVSADEILRGDLAEILYQAARPGVTYLFDDTITALAQESDSVLVKFEKAAPRRFDLVVGADGLHSVVRRLAFGKEQEAFHPLGLLNAWFTIPAEIDLDDWYLMHNAPGGRVVSVRPGRLPTEQKAGLSVRSIQSPDRGDIAAQLRLLEQHFTGVGWEAPRLLQAAGTAPDFYLESMGQVRLDRWSQDRVVLLGDAGYGPSPLTGMGTSLALVGAYILAGELAVSNDAREASEHGLIKAAFDRYESRMRPYVEQGQQLPPGGADGYAPMSSLRIALGWASMRWSQRWPMRLMMERIFSKADAIDLPEYKSRLSEASKTSEPSAPSYAPLEAR
jgi:2-polyprenyl-6-methoxyphenol hydroxylase-like FAD-dependent oxidoreductase